MRYKFLTILLMAQAFVLNSCQGVDHLFKHNFWIGMLIIAIIVTLMAGLAIKIFGKNTD